MKSRINVGYLFLTLCVATIISCSSNDKKDEGASPDVAEATSDAGAPQDENAAPQDATAAPQDANAAPQDANAAPADGTKPPETSEADMAANPPPAATDADAAALDGNTPPAPDANAAPADPNAPPPAADQASNPPPADAAPAAPETAANNSGGADQSQNDLFGAGSTDSTKDAGAPADAPAPKKLGIAHIKDAPFTRGGQNLNTVYIARDGDTLESVSQKLFGEDKTKQLKKANPSLKKGMKTGDKVYFNSPSRPDDKEKLLTVYEDQGLPPSTYTTKEGDTLKSLAQEWYGSEDSYKEVYALNKSLTSTKELPPGTELQYWPATAQVAVYGAKKGADVAQGPPGPDTMAQNNPPPPPAGQNNIPPPPPPGPPSPMDNNPPGAAAGMANNNQIPPPPPQAALPPPPAPDLAPPPPPMAKHKSKDLGSSAMGGMDKDTIMYAAAAGVLLIGSGLLIAIRRRNARKNGGITQV